MSMTTPRSVGAIDVHLHAMPARYRNALRDAIGPSVRTPDWNPAIALDMMDRHSIAAAILSLSAPGVHFGNDAEACELAHALNDEAAEVAARNPRLGAFATLPLPHVELACKEADHALSKLKLDGVCLLTNYGGCYLGHSSYDPLLELLDRHAAVVLVHPAAHPSVKQIALGVPNFMLEYPFDTTRAAVNMIFADVLNRYPCIQWILPHGGGTLPYLGWRIATSAMRQLSQPPAHERFLRDANPTVLTSRHELVTVDLMKQLMRRFWYDVALTADAPSLGSLLAFADPARILFGSDWPYAYDSVVADQQCSLFDPSIVLPVNQARIARGNAEALFPRFRSNEPSNHLQTMC